MKQAVFFDRDGVINKVILRNGKPFSPRKFEEFELSDGIKEILEKLKRKDFINIIITNQPDLTRHLVQQKELQKMHDLIRAKLPVDDIFVCPHDDGDNCNCRKPKPGMLLEAAEKWDIDLSNSFLIGDQWKDMEAGKAAGCVTIVLDYVYNQDVKADARIWDLWEALDVIAGVCGSIPSG
jgi:D-glycero-D-manno-heptose 1,7-bisphosphate phosphatase